MDDQALDHDQVQPEPARWTARIRRRGVITAAAVTGALVLGTIGMAAAQSGNSSTSSSPSSTTPAQPNPGAPGANPKFGGRMGPDGDFGRGHGPGGFGKFGAGPMGAIHGEFTTRDGNGGYRTVDVQQGTVTKVSNSSITVKSDDGFSKSYDVTTNTLVNAGRDGIGSVKEGDTVSIDAVVEGKNTTARNIMDFTNLKSIRDHWNPAPDKSQQQQPSSTTTT